MWVWDAGACRWRDRARAPDIIIILSNDIMPKEDTSTGSPPTTNSQVKNKNEKLLLKRMKQLNSDVESDYLEAAQSLESFLVS